MAGQFGLLTVVFLSATWLEAAAVQSRDSDANEVMAMTIQPKAVITSAKQPSRPIMRRASKGESSNDRNEAASVGANAVVESAREDVITNTQDKTRPIMRRAKKEESSNEAALVEANAVVETASLQSQSEDELQEKHYHALFYAVPQVLTNLSNFSGLVGQPNSMHKAISHKFGEDVESDKNLLRENVAGFVSLMQDILGDSSEIPVEGINSVLTTAICLIQSGAKDKADLEKYSLLEEMHTRFADIGWPTIKRHLRLQGSSHSDAVPDDYATPAQHSSCDRVSAWDKESSLIQTEESSARAAAYHTSRILVTAAKQTHAILDAHTHNSSAEATVSGLHQAWEPACKLLKCDSTNYRDLWRASHAHSTALIESGASAQHMQVHIRTRQKLELRMQRFLGEHGEHLSTIHRDEDGDFRNAPQQYFSRGRGALLQAVTSYPKQHSPSLEEYPLKMIASPKMQEYFEAKGKGELLEHLQGDDEDDDADDKSLALAEEELEGRDLEEDGNQRTLLSTRGGKGGKGIGGIGKKIGKGIGDVGKDIGDGIGDGIDGIEDGIDRGWKAGKDVDWSKMGTGKYWEDLATNGFDAVKIHGGPLLSRGVDEAWGLATSDEAKALTDELKRQGNGLAQRYRQSGIQNQLVNFAHGAANQMEEIGNDVVWVADAAHAFYNTAVEFIESLFECFGTYVDNFNVGYGKKLPDPWAVVGAGMGIVAQFSTGLLGLITGNNIEPAIKLQLSIVIGAVPGNVWTGGLRLGIGIAAGVKCGIDTCTVGLTVGSVGSALIPSVGTVPCPFGLVIGPTPQLQFRCFYSFTVVITALCCNFDLIEGGNDCR